MILETFVCSPLVSGVVLLRCSEVVGGWATHLHAPNRLATQVRSIDRHTESRRGARN